MIPEGVTLDDLPDPLLLIDQALTIVGANQSMVELLGWSHDELRARNVISLLHPDDQLLAASVLGQVTLTERYVIGSPVRL